MIPYVTIAGTNAWDADWYRDGLWSRMMTEQGFRHFKVNGRHFHWTTDANGFRIYRRWLKLSDWRDWETAGYNLADHLYGRLAPQDTNLFVHSHGLQPALMAAALGLKINTLTSIMSPVRQDLWITVDGERVDVLPEARKNIRFWQHLYTDRDRMAWWGLFGSGRFLRPQRDHPWATVGGAGINYLVPGVGHSGLLYDALTFGVWIPVLNAVRFFTSTAIPEAERP